MITEQTLRKFAINSSAGCGRNKLTKLQKGIALVTDCIQYSDIYKSGQVHSVPFVEQMAAAFTW